MKEIGGYFGLEEFCGCEYYHDLVAVNNARNALVYLIKARHVEKLFIPYFLCDSVSSVCDREGCVYEYYHIDRDLKPIFERELGEGEYLYLVNFYGQLTDEYVISLKEKYYRVILDNVQAFFTHPIKGIDTVYSCRKFFGVPDGGYVSTDAVLTEKLDLDVSMGRMRHVLGRYEGSCASDFYSDFKSNDHSFVELELRDMSRLTHNILKAIDYDGVKKKREENFKQLHDALGNRNELVIRLPDGPYAYPFYCKDGMKIKKALAEKKIFVATLWPNVLHMDGLLEKDYAENILPLPCDQRYCGEDINRIIKTLLNLLPELAIK